MGRFRGARRKRGEKKKGRGKSSGEWRVASGEWRKIMFKKTRKVKRLLLASLFLVSVLSQALRSSSILETSSLLFPIFCSSSRLENSSLLFPIFYSSRFDFHFLIPLLLPPKLGLVSRLGAEVRAGRSSLLRRAASLRPPRLSLRL